MTTTHEKIRALVDIGLRREGNALVDRVLRERPGAVCIDIGANVGEYVGYCLERGASRVHAFEPVPWVFEALTSAWGQNPRVALNRCGISDAAGPHINCRILNAHTLAPIDGTALKLAVALEDRGPFNFSTVTLDQYVKDAGLGQVDFIKLDVDGYEPAALRGMADVLAVFRPVVMIELSFLPRALGESCEAMIDGIYRAGYKLCTMTGEVCEDPLVVLEGFPWRTSFDMAMIPNERIASDWPRVR